MASQPAVIDDVRSQMGRDGKRAAQKTVLDARQRLTSSSGTRADFDFELMQDYAQGRVNAALPIAGIVSILAVVASFWVPVVFTTLWAGLVILSLLIVVLMSQRFRTSDPSKFNATQWTTTFVAGETIYGMAWSTLALFTLVADPQTLTPVMFAMVLVSVAANSVATHALPSATLMSTLPVTLTVSGNLIAVGRVGVQGIRVISPRADGQTALGQVGVDGGGLCGGQVGRVDMGGAGIAAGFARGGGPAGDFKGLETVGRRPCGHFGQGLGGERCGQQAQLHIASHAPRAAERSTASQNCIWWCPSSKLA